MKLAWKCMVLLATLLAAWTASAQSWPTKPVEITVPYPPGGSSDTIARLIAAKLQESLKQPFIVFNRPGASTVIGSAYVGRAKPDGYTLLLADNPFVVNATVMPNLSYHPLKDFAPVGIVGISPQFLYASASRSGSVANLIATAKAKPGQVTMANASPGSLTHLLGVIFENQAGVKFNHVPYKGSAPALQDVVGSQVDAVFSSAASGMPFVTSGKLRVLAATASKRSSALPDVPTFEELGFKNMVVDNWWGFLGPAGLPQPIIATLRAEIAKAVALPDVRERFAGLGVEPQAGAPEAFQQVLEAEYRVWAQVAKDNNIKVE